MTSPSFETADRARRHHGESLFKHRHVNGVGTGLRWRNGELTDERCVTVLVTKKRPRNYLPSAQVLPEYVTIDGVRCKVDVVQGGPFIGHGTPEFDPPGPTIDGEYRPLENGCEIGNAMGAGVERLDALSETRSTTHCVSCPTTTFSSSATLATSAIRSSNLAAVEQSPISRDSSNTLRRHQQRRSMRRLRLSPIRRWRAKPLRATVCLRSLLNTRQWACTSQGTP